MTTNGAGLAAADDTVHVSRADVTTSTPGRYAKQLVSHLGRKVEFAEQPTATWSASILGSLVRITVRDGSLVLEAQASDAGALARAEHVLGSHLERFGQRNELTVVWHRAAAFGV